MNSDQASRSDYDILLIQKKQQAHNMRREREKQKRYSVVCTFWMKGNCKKGDKCEYLHSNDPAKYSICHDHLLGV